MKKNLLFIPLFVLFLGSCNLNTNNTMIISGTLTNVESDTLIINITKPWADGERYTEEVALVNGTFEYVINDSSLVAVYVTAKPVLGQPMRMYGAGNALYLAPGTKLKIEGDVNNFKISGSPLYKDMEAHEEVKLIDQKISGIGKTMGELQREGKLTDDRRKELEDERVSLYKEKSESQVAYILENPNSELSAFYLTLVASIKVETAYNSLSDELKKGKYAPMLEARLQQAMDHKARLAAEEKLKPGMPAPTFSLKDIKGDLVNLEDFRGKYVVLDFWGTWCGWCITGFPKMKEYYSKYKSKMEFIGIACRDKEDAWKEGVKEHELPWVNLYTGFDMKVVNNYAVKGFPTKVIIDPEGKIVEITIGESPKFYEIVDRLMKK